MKIIHCADLHLDSKLTSNLSKDLARERKAELLDTFVRMVEYAGDNGIEAILIAGDMFDTKSISATAKNLVFNTINNNPDISFFILSGNHDSDTFVKGLSEVPENLFAFDDKWIHYSLTDSIIISGIELTDDNYLEIYDSLNLKNDVVNIVMLHGQEADSKSQKVSEQISIRELKNKNIDYLALGHIHMYKKESLDARGEYCYPGCLEGRGFDETGEHGFVVLDVDEALGRVATTFVLFAKRMLWDVPVDISGAMDTSGAMDIIDEALKSKNIPAKDLVKVTLTGNMDALAEYDTDVIAKRFDSYFYYIKVKDETKLKVDMNDFAYDQSLKGEFVRLVMNSSELSEDDKATVVRYGILALSGEEII